MGKCLHGWIQIAPSGDVWLDVIRVDSVVRGYDEIAVTLFEGGAPLGQSGLPEDLLEIYTSETLQRNFASEDGSGHVWFDWSEWSDFLSGADTAHARTVYRSDPSFVDALEEQRVTARAHFESADDWRLLLALVARLVETHGAANVRAVLWWTW